MTSPIPFPDPQGAGEERAWTGGPPQRRVCRLMAPALVSALALLTSALGATAQEVALPLGSQAPAAALEDLDGNPVQLLDHVEEGKPTLLEFWATWCEQCKALQPQMDEIQARYGARVNLVAVAVAVSQNPRRVKRDVEKAGHAYPFLWDAGGEAVRSYQVPTTSVVIILDQGGKVAYTGSGSSQDLVGAVERVLGG